MDSKTFKDVLESTFSRVRNVLDSKAGEYASNDDRLKNFRKAAHLQKETLHQALGGMMAKHTVSIYDMIEENGEYTLDQWDEKIIDHINYLILLRAVVQDINNKLGPWGEIPAKVEKPQSARSQYVDHFLDEGRYLRVECRTCAATSTNLRNDRWGREQAKVWENVHNYGCTWPKVDPAKPTFSRHPETTTSPSGEYSLCLVCQDRSFSVQRSRWGYAYLVNWETDHICRKEN